MRPFDRGEHFDWVAENDGKARRWQRGFHQQIRVFLKFHAQPGQRVLECGCGNGDLLASLEPSRGLGVDLSPKMIARAQNGHPGENLEFRVSDLQTKGVNEVFDVIILDYLAGYLGDIHACIANIRKSCHARTRIYVVSLNHILEPMLKLARVFRMATPQPPSNWVSSGDLSKIL